MFRCFEIFTTLLIVIFLLIDLIVLLDNIDSEAMCNLITEYFSGVVAFTRRHEFSKKNQNFYKEISSVSLDPSPAIGYNFQSQQDIR